MSNGVSEIGELKKLVNAFIAELDTQTMPYKGEALLGKTQFTEMSTAEREMGAPGLALEPTFTGEPPTVFNVGKPTELRWEATDLKRNGQYLSSAKKIIDAFHLEGHYDLVNLRNLWKTTLCGGDANGAIALIRKAIATYEGSEIAVQFERLPYPPHNDLADVLGALQTESSCTARLRDFSGNPDYVLPIPYREIKQDLQGSKTPQSSSGSQAKQHSSGGCYIATAVYGSYEAPEVLILRQFRDEHLQQSTLGRAFIKAYYAVSPSLASQLSKYRRPSAWIKRGLDSFVFSLQTKGDN